MGKSGLQVHFHFVASLMDVWALESGCLGFHLPCACAQASALTVASYPLREMMVVIPVIR